jgi:hypothetical protein
MNSRRRRNTDSSVEVMPAVPSANVIKTSNPPDLMGVAEDSRRHGSVARILLSLSATGFTQARENTMKQTEVNAVNVDLAPGDDGSDRVVLRLENGMDLALALTPAQARILATELITAVNRAEVKSSLKSSPNFWRRAGESRPRLATAN